MPGANQDNLPDFRAGQRLHAADLQAIIDSLRQQRLAPGQFQSGSFNVQRPMARSAGRGEAELVGEMALSTETIDAITAVDFDNLSTATKEAIDPDGHLAATADPRVFKLGVNTAHRYQVYKVNEGDEMSPDYQYYAVPLYEGTIESLSPLLVRVANMTESIPEDRLMQMKSVGAPESTEGGEGGFGNTANPASTSTVVSGIIDVVACFDAPELPEE